MEGLIIRVLSKEDWATYKELRLLSLQDSPDSFGWRYEQETLLPSDEWISRLDASNQAKNSLPLIAVLNGIPIGLAWAMLHCPGDKMAHIYQMWVSPSVRGQGVGRLLLKRIIVWAKQANLEHISLAVTTINIAAIHLYISIGFKPYGSLESLRETSDLSVQPMKLSLGINNVI